MRVAEDELVGRAVADIDDVEFSLFFSNACIETDVEQHIAQFLAYFVLLVLHQGIAKFECFFYGIGTQALVGLLFVPRTILAKCVQHIEISAKSGHFFFFCVHNNIFNHAKVHIFHENFVILHRFLLDKDKNRIKQDGISNKVRPASGRIEVVSVLVRQQTLQLEARRP